MLTVPPAVADGLREATARPFLYLELAQQILDHPMRTVDDWDGATMIAEHDTRVVPELGSSDPPGILRLDFPDPSRTETLFEISASTIDRQVDMQIGLLGSIISSPFQTFLITQGEEAAYAVSSMTVRLRRQTGLKTVGIQLEVGPYSDLGEFNAFGRGGSFFRHAKYSQTVNSPAISTSGADVTFSFSPALSVRRGVRYRVRLVHAPSLASSTLQDRIFWQGYLNRYLAPNEFSGIAGMTQDGQSQASELLMPGQELRLTFSTATYVFDGTTPAYRDILIDLGKVPTEPGYWALSFRRPRGACLRFRAWASNNVGAQLTALGATDSHTQAANFHDGADAHIHDGDAIMVFSQYYLVRVELLGTDDPTKVTQTLLETPSVFVVNPIFPESVVRMCTGPVSVLGAVPCVADVSFTPSKLDVNAYIAQPQKWTVQIQDDDLGILGDVASGGRLHNCPITAWLGLGDGAAVTSRDQLAPYAAGKITDQSITRTMLTLTVEPYTADLTRKLPQSSRVDATAPPATISFAEGVHKIDATLHLLCNELGVPRRMLIEDSFEAVKTALGPDWITWREIGAQQEGRELINQLMDDMGTFLLPMETGQLRLIQFPRAGDAVATWDASVLIGDTEQKNDFTGSIKNLCAVYYDYRPGAAMEFDPVPAFCWDERSIQDWAPGSDTAVRDVTVLGYWLGPRSTANPPAGGDQQALQIAARVVALRKDGLVSEKAQTGLGEFLVQVGDFIDLATPVYYRLGLRGSERAAQKFLVVGKTPALKDGTVTFDLLEALERFHAPVPVMSVTPLVGTAPFDVDVDATGTTDPDGIGGLIYEWDMDFDGDFQVDHAGATATHTYPAGTAGIKTVALRVRRTVGGPAALITTTVRAKAAPEAIIDVLSTTPGTQPTVLTLSALGSVPRSSRIVKTEWDFSYNGTTFVVEATDPVVTRGLFDRDSLVALRVTDEDGLTDMDTLLIGGKTALPANVTGLIATQDSEYVRMDWDANDDPDLWAYAVGLLGFGGDSLFMINREVLSTGLRIPVIRPFGIALIFAVYAIDSTGNLSALPAEAALTLRDPGTRVAVFERDEADLVFPGSPCGLCWDNAYGFGGGAWALAMGLIETYAAYIEVDPGADLVREDNRVRWEALPRNVASYIYIDKTAGYFSADFGFTFTFRFSSLPTNGGVILWALANAVGDQAALEALGASGRYLALVLKHNGTNAQLFLREFEASVGTDSSAYNLSANTTYYAWLSRNENGASGELRLDLYSDARRTTKLTTLTLTIAKQDFRYLYALMGLNDGNAATTSGWMGNLWYDQGTIEALSGYTETDPNNRLTVSGSRVTWASLTRDEAASLSYDAGAGFYSGDLADSFILQITGGNDELSQLSVLAYSTAISGATDRVEIQVSCDGTGTFSMWIDGVDDGSSFWQSVDTLFGNMNTSYWVRFTRTVTPTGFCYYSLQMFKDAERSVMVGSLGVRRPTRAFRYRLLAQTFDVNANVTISGYLEQHWPAGLGRLRTAWYETPELDLGASITAARLTLLPLAYAVENLVFAELAPQVRTSAALASWSAYAALVIGELTTRYLQARVMVTDPAPGHDLYVSNLLVSVDVEKFTNELPRLYIAVGGSSFTFDRPFQLDTPAPVYSIQIHGVTTAHFLETTNLSKTGFTAKLRRASDGADVGSSTETAGPGTLSTTGTAATTTSAHGLAAGDYMIVTSGGQAGQARKVLDTPTTTTATLESAFSANQSGVNWNKGAASGVRPVDVIVKGS